MIILVLWVLALVFFLLGAANAPGPINWVALGLAMAALTHVIGGSLR